MFLLLLHAAQQAVAVSSGQQQQAPVEKGQQGILTEVLRAQVQVAFEQFHAAYVELLQSHLGCAATTTLLSGLQKPQAAQYDRARTNVRRRLMALELDLRDQMEALTWS